MFSRFRSRTGGRSIWLSYKPPEARPIALTQIPADLFRRATEDLPERPKGEGRQTRTVIVPGIGNVMVSFEWSPTSKQQGYWRFVAAEAQPTADLFKTPVAISRQ